MKIIELLDENYVITSTKDKVVVGIKNKLANGSYDLVNFTEDKHLYVRKIEDDSSSQVVFNWQQKEKDDELKYTYGFKEVRIF